MNDVGVYMWLNVCQWGVCTCAEVGRMCVCVCVFGVNMRRVSLFGPDPSGTWALSVRVVCASVCVSMCECV